MSNIEYYTNAIDIMLRDGTIILTTVIGTILSLSLTSYELSGHISSGEYLVTVFLLFLGLFLVNSFVMILIINKTKNAFLKAHYLKNSRLAVKKYFLPIFILNAIFIMISMLTNQSSLVGLYLMNIIVEPVNAINTSIPFLIFVLWILVIPAYLLFIFACISIIVNQNPIKIAIKESMNVLAEIKIMTFLIIILPVAINYLLLFIIGFLSILTTYISFTFTITVATIIYLDNRRNEANVKDKVLNFSKQSQTPTKTI